MVSIKQIIFGIIYFFPVFLFSEPLDYEPGTLLIKLKQTSTTEVANSSLKNNEIKKAISALNRKWEAKEKDLVLKNIITTIYSRLVNFNLQDNQEVVKVLSFPRMFDLDEIKQDYQASGLVTEVEYNYYVYKQQQSFPISSFQYHLMHYSLKSTPVLQSDVQIPVAIIDTGVDITHPNLRDAIYINSQEVPFNNIDDDNNGYIDDYRGISFLGYSAQEAYSVDVTDTHGHGTHIAGIIAAQSVNSDGVWGLNPQAKIMPVKFMDSTGKGTQLDAAMAIRYAVDMGAKVINCSWGYFKKTSVLEDAINYAVKKGVIIVSAMGNSNTYIPEYPSAFESVLSVGAVSPVLQRSEYSNYGSHLDFVTFGNDIYSTLPGKSYGALSGTSQATAIVSGVVSRLLSLYPAMTYLGVYEMLKNNALDLGAEEYDQYNGYGLVQVDGMLLELNETVPSYNISVISETSTNTTPVPYLKYIGIVLGVVTAILVGIAL